MVEIDFDELDNIEFNTFNDQDKKANFLNKRKKVIKGTSEEKTERIGLKFTPKLHTPEQFGQPADLHPDTLPELIRTASRFIFGQF